MTTPRFIVVTDTDEKTSVMLDTDFIISAAPVPELSEVIQVQAGIPKGAKTAIRMKNMMNVYCDEEFRQIVELFGAVVAPGSIIKTDRPKVIALAPTDKVIQH